MINKEEWVSLENVAMSLGEDLARLYRLFHARVHPCWRLIDGERKWKLEEWRELLADPELDLDLSC